MRLKVGGGGGGAGLHLGGWRGWGAVVSIHPPLETLCPPLGDFNPSKVNTAHYTHAPLRHVFAPLPPLGIFLNEPLGGGGGGRYEAFS